MNYLLPILGAVLARQSGGGLGAGILGEKGVDRGGKLLIDLTFLPELLFAGCFVCFALQPENPWIITACVAWSYIWMQTGHGTAFHMGVAPHHAQGLRKQTLSAVIDPICYRFQWKLGEWQYCWMFMALKGMLIAAPLALSASPWLVLFGLTFPVAYWLGS